MNGVHSLRKTALRSELSMYVNDCDGGILAVADGHFDADEDNFKFIALSREAVPKLIAEVERLQSGYLTDEHGNEYVQVCILKEKIREQEAEIKRLREALKDSCLVDKR